MHIKYLLFWSSKWDPTDDGSKYVLKAKQPKLEKSWQSMKEVSQQEMFLRQTNFGSTLLPIFISKQKSTFTKRLNLLNM